MNFIENIIQEASSTKFRIFEFDKCYIITNPKVASRYVEFLFKKSNGICNSDINILTKYDSVYKNKKYVKTIFNYNKSYSDDITKNHENIFNIKQNKKDIILLIREPEKKFVSGLAQVLFLKILNEDILSGYIKAYSLYKQKPFNYTFTLFKKYENLLLTATNKSDSFHYDIIDLMNKEMEPEEVNYIIDYFEYNFLLNYKEILNDVHISPSNQNNLYLYNLIKNDNLIDLNKFKIIDISEFNDYSEYLISIGFDLSVRTKPLYSNTNVYSLVEKFLTNRENEELKLYLYNIMKSERVFYDTLKSVSSLIKSV